ncbi:MAG: hypothetical protein CSA49_04245 [Gammaproteobacteria bacterium]|nr:MAG: hypothetical protein CSA49_04245 [Gammaproteobacteria bacterium]
MHFSNAIDANIVRKALNEVESLCTAADCGLSYMALVAKFGDDLAQAGTRNDFWFHTRGALLGSFVINWCKLFGVDVKNQYWKQTTLEQKAFRECVYQKTGFNYQSWDKYRKAMGDLKAVMSDHMNPYYPIEQLPDLNPAIDIINVCYQWLKEVVEYLGLEMPAQLANDNYLEKVEADIQQTLDKF